ncbi:MAG: peptidase M16 [Haliea sp.]|uniref:insulinase family protein n=1 Tax=Haliea sp. TaxID=1932666 RepID=UPI000C6114FD|nr:insulinase family protein [Haliea sp.]MBM69838.1 peptidase M16 [Haliea sp.]|tara:strand:- start:30847 stop:33705 length:2859 start_codon:yes stop_codon:yes gene_type:complete
MQATRFGQWHRSLALFTVLALLAACASLPPAQPQPVKSPNDDYAYRYLTLPNQLEVLLISDPDAPKAAAALDVLVGSGDNPPGREGLAHFLEHMLFLGTDKYPEAGDYQQYIDQHGGSHNAYTSFEHTNYFFDIQAAYLPGALDRFAQFFIAPRFDAVYVEREMNAVEAEYQMGLRSDSRRGLDVLQDVMNPAHPFSQFTVGSLQTLADTPEQPIREDLLRFYEQHYSADKMRLVVFGAESLEQLEALVTPLFSAVPNREVEVTDIPEPLFTPESLPMLVQVQPQATLRQLEVSFPVADYRADYRSNPLAYLGNLVGHEGAGSLLSQLKAEGLAETLAAGSGLGWRGGALFSISIGLTEAGLAGQDRVLQLLFAYLDLLRAEGPQQWLYDEQSRLADLQFRFREQANPVNYVSALASGMHDYAPEDILRGGSLMSEYAPALIEELLAAVVPENALVTISHASVPVDRVSPHYEVPYSVQTVSAEQLARWTAPVGDTALALPAPNEFIAEDVTLVSEDPVAQTPLRTLETPRQTVWFGQDTEFGVPRGALYINFRSPHVGETPEQAAAALLYTALLKDAVNEFTYPALLAGLNFDVYKHAQGISLRISGYDDKQQRLLDRLLVAIDEASFSDQRFDNIRADMVRGLKNSVAKRPSSQVIDDAREALLHGEWGEQPLIDALEAISLSGLNAWVQDFWGEATAETLLYGNYTADKVPAVAERVNTLLAPGEPLAMPPLQVTRLEPGTALKYVVEVPHDDAVVGWYLQGAGDTWSDRAATALTAHVIKTGFYQQLRTEQQLGYVVSAFAWPQLDVPGLMMLIQSPNTPAPAIVEAMDRYLDGVDASLDEAQFLRYRDSLVGEILRPDKNLWERAEFYWQSIAKRETAFDSRQQLAEAVQSMALDDWRRYFDAVFMQQRRSLLVVAPGKAAAVPGGYGESVESAAAVKARMGGYTIQ